MDKRLTSAEIEVQRGIRGSRYWRRYNHANTIECPENGLPLWQAVNPFSYGSPSESERRGFNEHAAAHPFTRGYVHTTPVGFKYISYGEEPLTPRQVKDFRTLTFASLSDVTKRKLPPAVIKKYGGQVPLSAALIPFCQSDTGERRLAGIVLFNYPILLGEAVSKRHGRKRNYFFEPEQIHGFRIKLLHALSSDGLIDSSSVAARVYGPGE